MELRKKYSKFPENWAIKLYGLISDYGESIHKPLIFMIVLIFTTPLALMFADWLKSFIDSLIQYIPSNYFIYYTYLLTYTKYLKLVLGAKFYIGEGKTLPETIIYCIYSILSIIVMGNLYIALRRRLSRK